jgi:hypothetical protein
MVHYVLFEHLQNHKVAAVNLKHEMKSISNKSIEIEKEIKKEKLSIQMRITKEKLEAELQKKTECDKNIKILDLKLKNVKEVIENAIVVKPIIINVDSREGYDLSNGLIDANRDIVIKLLKIARNYSKIKNV